MNDLSSRISARRARAYATTSTPSLKVGVTYALPHTPQHAPSLSGAPHAGHLISSTSPHCTHRIPPPGDAIKRDGLYRSRPSTTYGTFDGHWQFGQYPRTICTSPGLTTPAAIIGNTSIPPRALRRSSSAFSIAARSSPSNSAIFPTASSESFVAIPASNIDTADCLQPTACARADWLSPFALRASLNFAHISAVRFCILRLFRWCK